MLDIAALLISLTALFAWLNHRFVRLPSAIGVMGIALVLSLGLVALGRLGFGGLADQAEALVASVDFSTVLMQGMLSVLLFAGSLHVDLGDLVEPEDADRGPGHRRACWSRPRWWASRPGASWRSWACRCASSTASSSARSSRPPTRSR